MTVVSVRLTTVQFNLESDPTQFLRVPFVSQINYAPQTPGEDRMYGNGRYVGLTAGATQRQVALAFQAIEPADLFKIQTWDGLLLCYRDDAATKFFGSYRSPAITRHQYDANADVTLTFTEKTYSEAV